MSDKVVLEFLVQTLYEKWLNKMFVFTINNKRVTSTQFFNYQLSTAFVEDRSLIEKARQTHLNVSRETLERKDYGIIRYNRSNGKCRLQGTFQS